jgi:photosystem II stability/assembly factor-like uncharacterized protein
VSDCRNLRRRGGVPGLGALLMVLVLLLVGCAEEQAPITLESIESVPGGQIASLQKITFEGEDYLVAPSGDQLVVRSLSDDDSQWHHVAARWPVTVETGAVRFFHTVERANLDGRFRPDRFFAVHDQRLWTVVLPGAGQPARVLVSADLGQHWEALELPDDHYSEPTLEAQRRNLLPSLRLVTVEDDLYLMDDEAIWRLSEEDSREDNDEDNGEEDGEDEASIWEPLSLDGLNLTVGDADDEEQVQNQDRQSRELPRRLRHYLPADEVNADEVVTVLGRKLEIYHRGAEQESFEKISELDALDRDFARDPYGDVWFIVDANVIYRSTDAGQTWEELSVTGYALAPEDFSQIEIFYDVHSEVGYQIWLIGDGGSLWRSDDGGDEWEVVADPDPDRRGVTGLIQDEDRGTWWAATAGRGVLRTESPGDWSQANEGLSAGIIYSAALIDGDRMLVGTDAGLFERRNGQFVDRWRQIDDRATSAMFGDAEESRIVTGTVGGSLVVRGDDDEAHSSEAAPLGSTEEILFMPPHLRRVTIAPSAIVTLATRAESRDIIAWSHRQGPLISNDGGSSWRRMQLGEAFRTALEHGVITHFITTGSQSYFAVTRSRRADRPAQLWRTIDGGQTWQATYSFMEDDQASPMQLIALPDGEGLFMAHGSHLAVSTDRGETWTPVTGDWESGVVTGLALDEERLVLVMNLAHATEILWIDDPLGRANLVRQYRMQWPLDQAGLSDRPVDLQVRGDRVLINESGRVFTGTVPRRRTSGPGSIALLLAMGAVLVMTTLAFGYLRTWET